MSDPFRPKVSFMTYREVLIAIDGATGRLCRTQHLAQAILAIAADGGLETPGGERIMPVPVLLGRNAEKLAAQAAAAGNLRWSTDRDAVLSDPSIDVYFDASSTAGRADRARAAIAAGKHVYLEKPIALSVDEALDLARLAERAGLKNGTVQDKLCLPGIRKLSRLSSEGFFGEIYSVRLDFGWWIFDGVNVPAQRSSWNYKKAEGGGLILDMFPHWRYILEHFVGPISAVSCQARTRMPVRRDESGKDYRVDVEDDVLATFEFENGVLAQIDSSWASRVHNHDMLTIQVDGSKGSATAGLHRCFLQPLGATPKPRWSVDSFDPQDFSDQWMEMPDIEPIHNGYRDGWEKFLRHVVLDTPFGATLLEGAKGVQLVEACHRSQAERRWIDLPRLML